MTVVKSTGSKLTLLQTADQNNRNKKAYDGSWSEPGLDLYFFVH